MRGTLLTLAAAALVAGCATYGKGTAARPQRASIGDWPDVSRLAAEQLIDRYGQPDEAMPSMLLWRNSGQWKRTVVHRDGITHRFPTPHVDVVEQTIDYRVPLDRVEDLSRFDGSLSINRTAGEVTSRSQTEEANWQVVNLVHEIVTGKRSVEDARRFFARRAMIEPAGKSYADGPLFGPQEGAADPDKPVDVELPPRP